MIKAVLFDLDGVLADTEPLRYESFRQLFWEEYAIQLPEEYSVKKGKPGRENLLLLLKRYGIKVFNVEYLLQKRNKLLNTLLKERLKQNENLSTYFLTLRQKGVKFALVTNSQYEYAEIILNKLCLSQFFSEIITSQLGLPGKPKPDLYLYCLQKLNITSYEGVAVEDTLFGVMAAQKAGLFTIAFQKYSQSSDVKKTADYWITEYPSLFNYINKMI